MHPCKIIRVDSLPQHSHLGDAPRVVRRYALPNDGVKIHQNCRAFMALLPTVGHVVNVSEKGAGQKWSHIFDVLSNGNVVTDATLRVIVGMEAGAMYNPAPAENRVEAAKRIIKEATGVEVASMPRIADVGRHTSLLIDHPIDAPIAPAIIYTVGTGSVVPDGAGMALGVVDGVFTYTVYVANGIHSFN